MERTFYFSPSYFNNKQEHIVKSTATLLRRTGKRHPEKINIKKVNGIQFSHIKLNDKTFIPNDAVIVFQETNEIEGVITVEQKKAEFDTWPYAVTGC